MAQISNVTYDEISVGRTARYTRRIGRREVILFAAASGDVNPLHLDADYASNTPFGEPIAHGILSASLISAAVALVLPGPGAVYVSQTLQFLRPVKIGDELTANLEVTAKRDDKRFITLACEIVNQLGKAVVSGEAVIMAPAEKQQVDEPLLPRITVEETGV